MLRLLEQDAEQTACGPGWDGRSRGKGAAGHHWVFSNNKEWFKINDPTATLGTHVAAHTLSHPGAHSAFDAALRALGPQHPLYDPPQG